MGKQNNTDNKLAMGVLLIIIIMGIIFLIFAFATLIAPVVIAVLFLVNWIRYLAQDRKRRSTNFWLTDYEQEQYEKTAYILTHAEGERKKVQNSVTIQGISRNQDGQISQRSYAGKELRERENTANSLINEYTPIYQELQSKPYNRWKKARKHYSNAFGFGLVILVFAAMFGIFELKNNNSDRFSKEESSVSTLVSEAADSTKVVVQPNETEQTEKVEQPELPGENTESSSENSDFMSFLKAILSLFGISIGFMAGILAALAIIWFIGWLIGRIRFGLKNPKPPLVSMDNVDIYIEEYIKKKERKEAERLQRKEEKIKERRKQKRIVKEQAKAEKCRTDEKKTKEAETQKNVEEMTSDGPVAEHERNASVPIENNMRQLSKEEKLFISWADTLKNEGYNITGNWENWENSGLWKNLAVISSVNGVGILIAVEYYVKSKRIYFGIKKLNDEEKVSQELLNSETFQNIITENGLTVKNNGSWYCLKFSTFNKVFQEYQHLIKTIN